MPRVTAVVVHYHDVAATGRCLASLALQVQRPDQMIVVEQSPAQRDRAEISQICQALREQIPDLLMLTPEVNLGFAGGCNLALRPLLGAGADAVAPEYAWLLNPDAEAEPAALQALLSRAEGNPALGAVASDLGDEQAGGVVQLWLGLAAPTRTSHPDFLSGASLLLRTAALRQAGLFDESLFLYWEDVDLCLRLKHHGWQLAVAPGSRVRHAGGGSTGQRSPVQDYFSVRNALLVTRKHKPLALPTAVVAVAFRTLLTKLLRGEGRRLRAALKGFRHGLAGHGGPLP